MIRPNFASAARRWLRRRSRGNLCPMNSTKIIAIVLIIAGVLGLAYGKFSYTRETHEAKVGPVELQVKDKETVNVPVWAGIGAIVIGAGLLLAGGRRA
jgi:hypothetical protein